LLTKEDAKKGTLQQYARKPHDEPIRSNQSENENELVDTKPDHQDEVVLSVSQDVDDRQVLSQGRRLDSGMDLATFEALCIASAEAAYPGTSLSGSDAYVNCVGGIVDGTSTPCATACGNTDQGGGVWSGGLCCTGRQTCGTINFDGTIIDGTGFTGKGK